MRLRGRTAAPQNVQVLERRQVLHLAVYLEALRTRPTLPHRRARLMTSAVEWLRGAATYVARAEPSHIVRLLLYIREHSFAGGLCAGSGRPGKRGVKDPQEDID